MFLSTLVLGCTVLGSALFLPGPTNGALSPVRPDVIGPDLIGPGSLLPQPELTDQHGKPGTLDRHARFIAISFEKRGAKLAKKWLEAKPHSYLSERRICCMADVRTMPGRVREKIFLPRLRKLPYRVLLMDQAADDARFPHEQNKLTLLVLDGKGTVTAVHFCDTVEALELLVEAS